jgi:hypothetical protein
MQRVRVASPPLLGRLRDRSMGWLMQPFDCGVPPLPVLVIFSEVAVLAEIRVGWGAVGGWRWRCNLARSLPEFTGCRRAASLQYSLLSLHTTWRHPSTPTHMTVDGQETRPPVEDWMATLMREGACKSLRIPLTPRMGGCSGSSL